MAPVAQGDIERDSHTSDMASQDSPLRRQFSEPLHARSTSTQASPSPSPSPMTHKSKCAWCGEYFESSSDSASQKEALKEHIATVHPHIAKFSTYDSPADGDAQSVDIHDNENDISDLDADDADDAANATDSEGSQIAEDVEDDHDDDDVDPDVEIADVTMAELAETTEIDENDREDHDLEGEGEGDVQEAESELALSNQLHEFSREQDSVSLDKRLHNLWNIHDIHNFTEDHDEVSSHLEKTWATVFHETKRSKKRDSVDFSERPGPYKKTKGTRGEFLDITSLEDFLSQLRDPEARSSDELYAITENVAYALKTWQDEYLAIEKLHKIATRHNAKPTSNPRKLERPAVFEDKKEATLYGYKHDPKEDKVGYQNPFTQGGFKPTGAQARRMAAKAGSDPNPDGWPTIVKFGIQHVPKFQNPPREEFVGKATRKRKAAELEAANQANDTDDAMEGSTPVDNEEPQIKRRTRSRRSDLLGETSPAPMRTSTRGRGRGRGRGGARMASRATSEVPSPTSMPSFRSSGRAQGRDVLASTEGASQARPAAHLAPIEPAPSGGAAASVAGSITSGVSHNDAMDAAEIARREKIANSKNPKRTEAMLNHWARFNREGRTRNPKRSKAQIEADRAAEAAKRAVEPPKMGKKKKPSPPVVFKGPTRLDTGLAPAPHMHHPPASLAPAPPGPHPQLAPMPPPTRGSLPPPYAPVDPRSMAPFPPGPPGPPGPLQQPPPAYHTPYPYMSPYGAAPPGLPPPGHTRPA